MLFLGLSRERVSTLSGCPSAEELRLGGVNLGVLQAGHWRTQGPGLGLCSRKVCIG